MSKTAKVESWQLAMADNRKSQEQVLKKPPGKHIANQRNSSAANNPQPITPRSGPGVNFKSAEEYNEEVIQLRKAMAALKAENDVLKTKCRQAEVESKKKRNIEESADPTKADKIFTVRNTDNALAIQNLKQKVFKLETQLKDKEASNQELRSQVKFTKVEEMKTQLETLYVEVLRTREQLDNSNKAPQSGRESVPIPAKSPGVDSARQQDSLVEALRRLNNENKSLREQLDALSKSQEVAAPPLLPPQEALPPPKKNTDRAENKKLREKLQAAEQREAALNQQVAASVEEINALKAENEKLKAREKERSIAAQNAAAPNPVPSIQTAPKTADPVKPKAKSAEMSKEQLRAVEEFRQNHAAKTIQKSWKKYWRVKNSNLFIQSALKGFLAREQALKNKTN